VLSATAEIRKLDSCARSRVVDPVCQPDPGCSGGGGYGRAPGVGTPTPGPRTETTVDIFRGADPAQWRSALPTIRSVELGEIWPAVRLELAAHVMSVEQLFEVLPWASGRSAHGSVSGWRAPRGGAIM